MNYAQIQGELNSVDRSSWPKLSIAILRNITVEPIEPYLRHFAANIGCDAEVRFGAIDNIAQEALGADGLLLDGAEVVLLFTYLDGASWDLARRFTALSADQVTAEIARVTALVA